jgi:hypothetical protein
MFAEVGPKLITQMACQRPMQYAMDNLDTADAHLMMKCSVREQVDTRGLSTNLFQCGHFAL